MKTTIILSYIFTILWSPTSEAYRNCNMECPISFAPSDSSNPLQNYQERENCLSRCQQANSQQAELEQQTLEMEEQTKLLKEQKEEQEQIRNELEEQRDMIEDME